MAEIYSQDGEEITFGLQGSDVCDEAWIFAKEFASERGEVVRLEDDDGNWDVHPDGHRTAADEWEPNE